jgi:tetratricopeptide (TPR) repeat protein
MPFLLALVIRGSELTEGNTFTVSLHSWFYKVATSVCGFIFIFMTINDVTWMRDIHMMNRIVAGELTNTPWQPANPIFNQAYITGGRSVNQALTDAGQDRTALFIVEPLLSYWPDSAANTLLPAENHLNLGNYEESEYWARKTAETQPAGTYMGEFYLMDNYLRNNRMDDLRSLYEAMKTEPEELLSRYSNTLNMMHSMSINVQDFEMTPYYYEKFTEHFGEFAPVIANQAVYLVNTGKIPDAIPLMVKALEMNPDLPLRDQFEQIMAQYPSYLFSQPE